MATVYSQKFTTGAYTYTRVRVDYTGTTAKATLLFTRTGNGDVPASVLGHTYTFGNKSVGLNKTITGLVTDAEIATVEFPISLDGGTYSGSVPTQAGVFAFAGSVTIPAQQMPRIPTMNQWKDLISHISPSKTFYATCTTDANTATKIIDCPGFDFADATIGTRLCITMGDGQKVDGQIQFNVNDTGAQDFYAKQGDPDAVDAWQAGESIDVVFDGIAWCMVGAETDTTEIVQDKGESESAVMSQKAVSNALDSIGDTADEAKEIADNAKVTANEAMTKAGDAQSSADAAQTTADNAQSAADAAQTSADEAKTAADNAQGTADTAKTAAEVADTKAQGAQSTADKAVTDAAAAQETADKAVSDAAQAQSTANTAVTNAATAQTTANKGVSDAAAAQATADGLATSKQDKLVSGTNIKTVNNTSLLGNGNVAVQATLVSGTNIKTINNSSILGSGNIQIDVPTISNATGDSTTSGISQKAATDAINAVSTTASGKQDALVSGTNIKTVNGTSILGSGDIQISVPTISNSTGSSTTAGISQKAATDALGGKQATLVSGTNIKTINNTSVLGSGNIAVQPTLVSGTNIKTINNNSILGSGNISISAGGWKNITFTASGDNYVLGTEVAGCSFIVVTYQYHQGHPLDLGYQESSTIVDLNSSHVVPFYQFENYYVYMSQAGVETNGVKFAIAWYSYNSSTRTLTYSAGRTYKPELLTGKGDYQTIGSVTSGAKISIVRIKGM